MNLPPPGRALRMICALSVLLLPRLADAKLSRVGEPTVTFRAVGPAGMKIEGTTHELAVTDDGQVVTVAVLLGNLTTGISLRDRHMREKYLQVPQYPTAEFTVARSAIKIPAGGAAASADVAGTMRLHGRTKAVPVHYDAKRDAALHVTGTVRVNMTDFGIEVPTYLGVSVKPDVDVIVRFDLDGD